MHEKENGEKTVSRLLEKSQEAFVLAVELYNRPSLKYGAESCSILLCNAWELMLKAHIINKWGIESIYYKSDPTKTLTLSDCLKKVFTNEKSPLRSNMNAVMRFRNTNTHYITDEYEIFYGPFLQASVENYADTLMEFHSLSVSDLIPENRLALAIRKGDITPETIRAKYDPAVAQHLLTSEDAVAREVSSKGDPRIAAIYETTLRLVKKKNDADLNVHVQKDAKGKISIVRDIKDPTSYYPYTAKRAIEKIDKLLKKRGVTFYFNGEVKEKFTGHSFQLFVKFYDMKGNDRFAYDRKTPGEKNHSWIYSEQTIVFISDKVEKNPHSCLDHLNIYSKKNCGYS